MTYNERRNSLVYHINIRTTYTPKTKFIKKKRNENKRCKKYSKWCSSEWKKKNDNAKKYHIFIEISHYFNRATDTNNNKRSQTMWQTVILHAFMLKEFLA